MQTIGIKDLKTNPAVLPRGIAASEHVLISLHGKPFAIATALDDPLFDHGLKTSLLIRAYADGGLSLGQLSRALDKSNSDILKLLNLRDIPVLDYDLADELETLDSWVRSC